MAEKQYSTGGHVRGGLIKSRKTIAKYKVMCIVAVLILRGKKELKSKLNFLKTSLKKKTISSKSGNSC